ncbi:Hypothetical protein A7982_02184 [Minicystis rosea]|nr:Hypothetical protein A7982_02184 [Minicystis rosea]
MPVRSGSDPAAAARGATPSLLQLEHDAHGSMWIVLQNVAETPPPANAAWTVTDAHSYVPITTAPAPPLSKPRTITLLGPERACVVEVIATSYLHFGSPQPPPSPSPAQLAAEVTAKRCAGTYLIAVDGRATDARAIRHDMIGPSRQIWSEDWIERATAACGPMTVRDRERSLSYIRAVRGSNLELVTLFMHAEPTPAELLVRNGKVERCELGVTTFGMLAWGERNWLIVGTAHAKRAVPIDVDVLSLAKR